MVEPRVPILHLPAIARDLDRRANCELNNGRFLIAEKLASRAEELRAVAALTPPEVAFLAWRERGLPSLTVVGGRG
jgi:hypothetical protein